MFRLAMVQMRVEGGRPEANLRRAEGCIAHAAEHHAAVVLLPEAMDLGWTHPHATRLAEPIPDGAACRTLCDAARRHDLFVCAGLTERDGDRLFNAAILVDPTGGILLHHRKLNELEIGQHCYSQGDRLAVAQTDLGAFGLMICADAFAGGQVISRTLGYMGAQVILSPCAWAVPADHDNHTEPYGALWRESYGPVARDFSMWIAGCSNVGPIVGGPWDGRICIGCSMIVGPDGATTLQGPYGADAQTVLYADIEPPPRPARGDAWRDLWRSANLG